MKTLEKGPEKIKKICELLREETLEPAKQEAEELIKQAHKRAEQIIAEAQKAAEELHANAKTAIEQEHNVFSASLEQAAKQSQEALRQSIENYFFNERLPAIIEKNAAEPSLVANLINAIIKALESEGLAANLSALIPKTLTPKQINALLLDDVLHKLKEHSVTIGNFSGGAKVKVDDRNMTIDISEDALRDLMSSYIVRKDFRKMLFANQ